MKAETMQAEATTTAMLSLALDAASWRQRVIAANLANADSEGYAPLRVSFEEQLEQARAELHERGRVDATTLADVRPQAEEAVASDGRPVQLQLDQQMAQLAENAVHFQALLQGLSRHLALLAMAAADGRR